MGYETAYSLTLFATDNPEHRNAIIEDLRNSYDGAKYALDENGDMEDTCKWYDHEKNLKEFSIKYPEVLFKLWGMGEEAFDMWYKYFLNGKRQFCKAKITYDEFDESKLE